MKRSYNLASDYFVQLYLPSPGLGGVNMEALGVWFRAQVVGVLVSA